MTPTPSPTEARDDIYFDEGGLWVRDPQGNCRPFDIHDYESLAADIDALLAREEALVGALSSAAAVIIGVARSFAPGHAPQELVVEAEKIATLLRPDLLPETAEGDA